MMLLVLFVKQVIFFRKNYLLSKQEKNDLIIICSAGAYGSSMSSDYNLRGFANEVLIDGNKIL